MGYYINPPSETKEEFLAREGTRVHFLSQQEVEMIWNRCPKDQAVVVWIKNQLFSAAGIAYCLDELKAFTEDSDPRPKRIYYVSKETLKPYYQF